MNRKTPLRVAALTLALAVLPTVASAVSVGSYHGNGTQYRTASYNNGAQVDGRLRSIQGYPVYYEGKLNWRGSGCASSTVAGRYSNNTSSTSYVGRGGTIADYPGSCTSTSVNSRVSRDISFSPDPSGYWSSNY